MKPNIRLINKHRRYSEEFKKQVVSLFEKGKYSVLQMERLYGVANGRIYDWIYKYSTFNQAGIRVVEMKKSSMDKIKALEQKVKELEQMVGQKQIKIEYLEKMIDLAKTELDIDIKKNYNTPPSATSAAAGKKQAGQ
jgi:transposase